MKPQKTYSNNVVDCQFWTFNKTEEKCYYAKIFKVSGPEISFIIGSMATYQQITFEYFLFTVFNGILGFVIFFFHCTSNETVSFWIFKTCFNMQNCNFSQVRAKLSACFGKICGKKKSETDTEAIASLNAYKGIRIAHT